MSSLLVFLLALAFLLGGLYMLRDWGDIDKRRDQHKHSIDERESSETDSKSDKHTD